MKIRILFLLVLFLTFVSVAPLQAQQGLLMLVKGSVKVIGPERTSLLRKPGAKIALKANDRVQTGKDTFAKIKIKGKPEIIELTSRAFFRMGKITRQTSSISLLTGKARFKIKGKLKKKSKRKRFQIRTVTALVGVKGTDFVVGASNTQTSLLTISGTVSVAPVSMPDIEIEVPANQASTVQQNSTPTEPVELTPKMRAQIVKDDSPKAFSKVKFGKAVNPEEVRKENEKKKKEEEEEQKKEEEKQKEENSKEDGEPKKEGEGKDGEGEPKPGEEDPEGESKDGEEGGPPGEKEDGQEPQDGEDGPGTKDSTGPGVPGEGEDDEGALIGPEGEGAPGDEEGPRGEFGPEGEDGEAPGGSFGPGNDEDTPSPNFKPEDGGDAPSGISLPKGGCLLYTSPSPRD